MTLTISLTLTEEGLKYLDKNNNWQLVDKDHPSTAVNEGDEIDWQADHTIKKIKIKPGKGKIFDKVQNDDSKKPKGILKKGLTGKLTEYYIIQVKPSASKEEDGYLDFDPKVTFPAER